jgi:hypothetical protein
MAVWAAEGPISISYMTLMMARQTFPYHERRLVSRNAANEVKYVVKE